MQKESKVIKIDKNNYLSDIYNTLILRDIVQKYNIKNATFETLIDCED